MRRPGEIPLTAAARKLRMHRQTLWRLWKRGEIAGRRETVRKVFLLERSLQAYQRRMEEL